MDPWQALAAPPEQSTLKAQALSALPDGTRTWDNLQAFFAPCLPAPVEFLKAPQVFVFSLLVRATVRARLTLPFKVHSASVAAVLIYADGPDGPVPVDIGDLGTAYQLTDDRPTLTVELEVTALRQG